MKIVISNSARGAYKGVLNHLKQNRDGTSSNVVLAPDRFTASVERGIISSLSLESSFGIEVMSFSRLANKLLGESIKKCLTPQGAVMLIGEVIGKLCDSGELKYYNKVGKIDGFASELYAALTAIRNSGVDSDVLRQTSKKLPIALKNKMEDIALIYESYLKALEGRHSDSSTRLIALVEFLKNNPQSVATTHFYCVDIYDFSSPELEIVKSLAKSALSLTVGIPSGGDNPNKRIYPDYVIEKLKGVCENKVEIERNDEQLSKQIDTISTRLFSYSFSKQRVENDEKVHLRVAKDKSDEVLALAMDIVAHVRGGGRYKDFEVCANDIEDYEGEIKSVFQRYSIPFFIDKKELLSEQTKASFVLEALGVVRSNFRRREVLDFVKNPLFYSSIEGGIDDVFKFENYVLKYNVDYTRFNAPFEFYDEKDYQRKIAQSNVKAVKNSVLSGDFVDVKKENAIPEKVRLSLERMLLPFKIDANSFLKSAGMKQIVLAIRQLLDGIDSTWRAHVDKLAKMSEYYQKCAEQVDSKIASVLDEIEDVLDFESDISRFENIFKSMLKTIKISLVPTFLDCVFVGDMSSRFMGAGDLYVLGATYSKFPKTSLGGTVLSIKDEELLSSAGVEIVPNERQKLKTAMYAVCDLLKKPHGKIVISYAESGDSSRPSSVIGELRGMLANDGKPLDVERIDFDHLTRDANFDGKVSTLFSTRRGCYYESLKNGISSRALGEEMAIYASAYTFVAHEDKLRVEKRVEMPSRIAMPSGLSFKDSTSVSRLEKFYTCPYAHYFSYILSLKKRKESTFEGTENGTILHHILELFFTDIMQNKIDDSSNFRELACAYFDDAIEKNDYELLLKKEETRRLLYRVRNESVKLIEDMYQISKRSKFKPAMLEAKIGEGEIKPLSLIQDGKTIKLKGVIDRVDTYEDKFVIIDYKTFKSADIELKDLYYGKKIQLYMYMNAVRQSCDKKPVGVFYLPIFASFTSDDESRYKLKGQVCNSIEIMTEIDSKVADNPRESIVPFKTAKGGVLSGEKHLSEREFEMLGNYATQVAIKGAEEIVSGYVKPAFVNGACTYCDYQDICEYKGVCEREFDTVKIASFDKDATVEE